MQFIFMINIFIYLFKTLQHFLKATILYYYSLIGIAMPYPLESSVLPISIRLQLRSVWYSMLDDSMKNAYRPLPLSTRSTPSWLLFVKTVGLDASITLHILWYKLKFDFCTIQQAWWQVHRHYNIWFSIVDLIKRQRVENLFCFRRDLDFFYTYHHHHLIIKLVYILVFF